MRNAPSLASWATSIPLLFPRPLHSRPASRRGSVDDDELDARICPVGGAAVVAALPVHADGANEVEVCRHRFQRSAVPDWPAFDRFELRPWHLLQLLEVFVA